VQREADRLVLHRYAPAGLIVDQAMQILHFRGQASDYLAPAAGEASLSLMRMVRPEFAVELRTSLHKARQSGSPVRHDAISSKRNGQIHRVSLEVIPISGNAGEKLFLVLFEEEPQLEPSKGRRVALKNRIDKAEESQVLQLQRELQTTKDYLQSIIEEQEATNEELKSANEEVLSSNEELQSANEELETAKEELQSANEELVTVNEQLQNSNVELAALSDDLSNLLAGVSFPIVMLDNDRRIRRFTPLAAKLLNLLPADLGRPIGNIRPDIDIPNLERLIGEVIDTMSVKEQDVQDIDGRWHSLRIRPYKTTENRIEGVVMVFIDIDPLKRSQEELRQEHDFVAGVLDTVPALVTVVDREQRIVGFNRTCQELTGYSLEEARSRRPCEFLASPEEAEQVRADYRRILDGRAIGMKEYHWSVKSGGRRLIWWSSSVLRDEAGAVKYAILSGMDITARRAADQALRDSEAALRQSEERLRVLAAGLLKMQEAERRRLARDIHDDLSQRAVAWAWEASAMAKAGPLAAEDFRVKMNSLVERATQMCSDLEGIARELHPATIEKLGLVPALESLVSEVSGRNRIKIRFTHEELPAAISHETSLALYRVAQEALRNVIRHSGASRAHVNLAAVEGGISLSISDSGRGFHAEQVQRGRGLGLISMEERVRILGGAFSLAAKPGHGVKIQARIPLMPPDGGEL
jgi:two-component system, chemotaxis family, CheB/CheR fusion protein